MNYNVDDGVGTNVAQGLAFEAAMTRARDVADQTGLTAIVYGDGEPDTVKVHPIDRSLTKRSMPTATAYFVMSDRGALKVQRGGLSAAVVSGFSDATTWKTAKGAEKAAAAIRDGMSTQWAATARAVPLTDSTAAEHTRIINEEKRGSREADRLMGDLSRAHVRLSMAPFTTTASDGTTVTTTKDDIMVEIEAAQKAITDGLQDPSIARWITIRS